MLRTVSDQPTLWDAILPAELLVLPGELARVDALLGAPEGPDLRGLEPLTRTLPGPGGMHDQAGQDHFRAAHWVLDSTGRDEDHRAIDAIAAAAPSTSARAAAMSASEQSQIRTRMFARSLGPFFAIVPTTVAVRGLVHPNTVYGIQGQPMWPWLQG